MEDSHSRACLVVALGASACAKNVEARKAPAFTAAEFYPLAIGNSWTYESNFLGQKKELTVAITGQADGFFIDTAGGKLTADAYGVRDQLRYLLRDPVEANRTWTNVVSVSSIENYEIVAANQACDAPAGKWDNCVVVESRNRVEEGTTLVNEMTFAPGVGIVRLSTVLESNGKHIPQSTLALVKFKPPAG